MVSLNVGNPEELTENKMDDLLSSLSNSRTSEVELRGITSASSPNFFKFLLKLLKFPIKKLDLSCIKILDENQFKKNKTALSAIETLVISDSVFDQLQCMSSLSLIESMRSLHTLIVKSKQDGKTYEGTVSIKNALYRSSTCITADWKVITLSHENLRLASSYSLMENNSIEEISFSKCHIHQLSDNELLALLDKLIILAVAKKEVKLKLRFTAAELNKLLSGVQSTAPAITARLRILFARCEIEVLRSLKIDSKTFAEQEHFFKEKAASLRNPVELIKDELQLEKEIVQAASGKKNLELVIERIENKMKGWPDQSNCLSFLFDFGKIGKKQFINSVLREVRKKAKNVEELLTIKTISGKTLQQALNHNRYSLWKKEKTASLTEIEQYIAELKTAPS